MLKTLLLSSCLLLSLPASAFLNDDKNENRSHKENTRKNHDCRCTQINVLSKQTTKDIAQQKKTAYQQTKNELNPLKGSVSLILKNLENSPEREDKN
jgi:hypothetical protein